MAKVKFYQVEKEIGGVKYMAQFSGLRAWTRCADAAQNADGTVSNEKLIDGVLSAGIVDPKVTLDDFETEEELMAVYNFAKSVMTGRFRSQQETGQGAEGTGE